MASNPNPSKITNEMWWLWEECLRNIPGVQLGGIYANKSCYHNTVSANKSSWPSAYCIKLPLDLNYGPKDKSRGIDLTMSTSEMIKRTKLLKACADHPTDTRLFGVREFIGTIDGNNVFCYIRDTDSGPWRFDGSRDSSHLWHIHISIWTKYCNVMDAMEQLASAINGAPVESVEEDFMYVLIDSTDVNFDNTMWVTDGNTRRKVRNPGEIRNGVIKAFGRTVTFTDADRDGRAWTDYLDGVLGYDWGIRVGNLSAKLDEILLAAQDDGDMTVVLPPEYQEILEDIKNNMATEADVRDAVADLGEGGAAQVRADQEA